MPKSRWLTVGKELPANRRLLLAVLSFLIPVAIWGAVSYVPFLWHPQVRIEDPGDVLYFDAGDRVELALFREENQRMLDAGMSPAQGVRANPVFLPAPHEVAVAFYTAFKTPPRRTGDAWLHESLWHSITIIFWGFTLSTLIGVPLGVMCGAFSLFSRLIEPFVEFFRYLPAPAFGALAVAILGINDAPKIAIIFIGTFFQQVLIVANTTRRVEPALLEAAQTLGASRAQLFTRVVVPAAITDIYNDLRILLGWAWTYLIVAELIGRSSGITFFISQQARYRNFDNVFAAIIMIGIIGLGTDMVLSWMGKRLFPWKTGKGGRLAGFLGRLFGPREQTVFTR
jgi:NitT/TauT family transport system permease protein